MIRTLPLSQPAIDMGTELQTSGLYPSGGCGNQTMANCPGVGADSQGSLGASQIECPTVVALVISMIFDGMGYLTGTTPEFARESLQGHDTPCGSSILLAPG